ncbi:MAG TPA: PH domain-containing protein [Gemmataceae bacterium]|nr:PH domain-containing protein [Gemmataceae bacterium]
MTGPADELADDLRPGERLVWAGRARGGVILRPADLFLVPFSLAWCTIVGFIATMTVRDGAPWFVAVFAGLFLLVGLYLLAGRHWFDTARRARTLYAVTSDRVVIRSRLFGRKLKSLPLSKVTDVTLREGRGGAGTITFGAVSKEALWLAGSGIPGAEDYAVPMLELGPGARDVYNLILDAHQAAAGKHP